MATRTKTEQELSALLLRHTDGATLTAGGLGVLTANAQTPEMTQTTMGAKDNIR